MSRAAPAVAWAVAVLGATAMLVAPITPWLLVVEIAGLVICLVASGVLAVVYFRR